ncbi:MAG: argininosuccinate lyase [Verrucomicrobiota bacterium]|nr:argininosuccinate lyase [Verrucomicrobiota bacterium]
MNLKPKTSIAAVALSLFSLLGVTHSFAEGKQDFTLHNETGKVIKEVYVGPTQSEEWGDDVMGKEVVGEGESVLITFHPKATANHWDLKIVFDDDKWTVWTNFDLTTISDITISYKDGKPWATWK